MPKLTYTNIAGPSAALSWAGAWASGTDYKKNQQTANDGDLYVCLENHTSAAGNEPGTGASWETYWARSVDMLTADQIAACAGTGTPGSGNKFVTNDTHANHTGLTGTSAHLGFIASHYAHDTNWTGGADTSATTRRSIVSPNEIHVRVGTMSLVLPVQISLDLDTSANWDSATYATAANRAGKDFYVYLCQPVSGTTPVVLCSANSTYPSGYAADTSRKVAGFHCLCLNVGTISGHSLTGYLTGDVLPASVWDLKFRPVSNPEGMVYSEKADIWVDIYLASGTGASTASVFGATCSDTRTWLDFVDDGAAVKKRLLNDPEFQVIAVGSNEETNISGSADPGNTGGKSDTASRRMISFIGCEDCCGNLWQWLGEQSYGFNAAAAHTHSITVSGDPQTVTSGAASGDVAPAWAYFDLPGSKGSLYRQGTYGDVKLMAGGPWNVATACGSRGRFAQFSRWDGRQDVGTRFAARSKTNV